MTNRWVECSECRFSERCTKSSTKTGCHHPVKQRLPTHALAVTRAKNLYRASGADDARAWLTMQYLDLIADGASRWRHEHPDAPRGELIDDRGRLRIAEAAAGGVVKCFELCTELDSTGCENCRTNSCRRRLL